MLGSACAEDYDSLVESITDREYQRFQKIILNATGIYLDDNKKSLIYNRIQRRIKELKLENFTEYLDLVETRNEPEWSRFISSITTNYTYFYREPKHFEFLKNTIIPEYIANDKKKSIKVWSAASSSGEEVYSIAMTFADLMDPKRVKILATDIDEEMLRATHKGIYKKNMLRGLSDYHKVKWLNKINDNQLQVNNNLRDMVITKKLNLCDRWPIRPSVDVIFCRNVLIYFQSDVQDKIVNRFKDIQKKGSYLILGHTESMRKLADHYHRLENTIYIRK